MLQTAYNHYITQILPILVQVTGIIVTKGFSQGSLPALKMLKNHNGQ